jgi:ribonuclease BN (tRNA processing enzyme)
MKVRAYPVVHCGSIEGQGVLAPVPAMGYRFSYNEEIIAISGDTGLCSAVKQLATGADLAIIEAVYEKTADMAEEVLEKVHLSTEKAREIGRLAGEHILIHQGKWHKE